MTAKVADALNLVIGIKLKAVGNSHEVKVKVKQSRYRPGVAQRVPGS